MSKGPIVYVTYDKNFIQQVAGPDLEVLIDALDLRFQPFFETPVFGTVIKDEEIADLPTTSVIVDKWLMTEQFRNKVNNGEFMTVLTRSRTALDVNAYLTVFSHFGFDADYRKRFVRYMEPFLGEMLLQSYRTTQNSNPIADREFHGEVMPRSTYIERFDAFLCKYEL